MSSSETEQVCRPIAAADREGQRARRVCSSPLRQESRSSRDCCTANTRLLRLCRARSFICSTSWRGASACDGSPGLGSRLPTSPHADPVDEVRHVLMAAQRSESPLSGAACCCQRCIAALPAIAEGIASRFVGRRVGVVDLRRRSCRKHVGHPCDVARVEMDVRVAAPDECRRSIGRSLSVPRA